MSERNEMVKLLEKIDKKLGFIIGEKIKENNSTVKDQIKELMSLTSDYNEMARILGISAKHASKELSLLKKGRKK